MKKFLIPNLSIFETKIFFSLKYTNEAKLTSGNGYVRSGVGVGSVQNGTDKCLLKEAKRLIKSKTQRKTGNECGTKMNINLYEKL